MRRSGVHPRTRRSKSGHPWPHFLLSLNTRVNKRSFDSNQDNTVAKVTKSFQYGNHEVTLETGEIARQASGAVMVSMGGTVVLVTAVAATKQREGQDFFPLTVDYVEKFYSAGRIPGGFFKREGRPTEKETLTSRLIDRPVRPLFPEDFKNEVQVIAPGRLDESRGRRRHPGADRRLRCAEPCRHPVQGPDRRRPRRLRRWQVPAQPDRHRAEDLATSIWSSPVPPARC